MSKWIALPIISVFSLLLLSTCALSPAEVINPEPTPEPCAFELPSLSGYEQRTKNDGSVEFVFEQAEPPEEWLLATDEHPDAYVILYEDGGMAIRLPGDYEIESLENGRVLLRLPGCSQVEE
jgi:hypothetical protein